MAMKDCASGASAAQMADENRLKEPANSPAPQAVVCPGRLYRTREDSGSAWNTRSVRVISCQYGRDKPDNQSNTSGVGAHLGLKSRINAATADFRMRTVGCGAGTESRT